MGTVLVRFVVTEKGEVTNIEVLRRLEVSADAAVVAAVARLPRFTPGKQGGRAVRVYETVPVWLNCSAGPAPVHQLAGANVGETFATDSSKVYVYIEQEPALPSGGGVAAIQAALRQRLVLPADTPFGQVFVQFTVGPHGSVYNEHIIKGLSSAADAAVLTAVRQLPRFLPGHQSGRAVAFSFTVPLTVGTPSPAAPTR